jgi:hypothetical protein
MELVVTENTSEVYVIIITLYFMGFTNVTTEEIMEIHGVLGMAGCMKLFLKDLLSGQ